MEKMVLTGFLLTAAWQDLRKQEVDVWVFGFFGALGVALAVYRWLVPGETYALLEHGAGIGLGLALLGICRLSRGAIGIGDGCFFLVTGVLLGFWENVALLCYGTLCCGVYCLCWFTWGSLRGRTDLRTKTVPFLPFVALPGIWLAWGL